MQRSVYIETTIPSFYVDMGLFVPVVTTPDLVVNQEVEDGWR